jgi:hypothetical protein
MDGKESLLLLLISAYQHTLFGGIVGVWMMAWGSPLPDYTCDIDTLYFFTVYMFLGMDILFPVCIKRCRVLKSCCGR